MRPSAARLWARRIAALGALAVAGIAAWLLLGGGGELPGLTDRHGAKVEDPTIPSKAVDADQTVKVVIPDTEVEHPPLLVFLHGRGGDESSELYDPMFAALEEAGDRARSSLSRTEARAPTGTTAPAATGTPTWSTR